MPRPRTIAIDGPAGTGKSTISQIIAERFGYVFVDTGAFYRAVTYVLLQTGVSLKDHDLVKNVVDHIQLRIVPEPAADYRVIANGDDVTAYLRSKKVEASVSAVAEMPYVREALLPLQRQVAEGGNIILAGRDIGTVVLPDADLKLYIDASLEERARRRHKQLTDAGKNADAAEVQSALAERDRVDSERSLAPLSRADDAIYILTDGKSIDDVVQEISQRIETWETEKS